MTNTWVILITGKWSVAMPDKSAIKRSDANADRAIVTKGTIAITGER